MSGERTTERAGAAMTTTGVAAVVAPADLGA